MLGDTSLSKPPPFRVTNRRWMVVIICPDIVGMFCGFVFLFTSNFFPGPVLAAKRLKLDTWKAIVKALAIQEDEVSWCMIFCFAICFRCHVKTRSLFESNGFPNSNWWFIMSFSMFKCFYVFLGTWCFMVGFPEISLLQRGWTWFLIKQSL